MNSCAGLTLNELILIATAIPLMLIGLFAFGKLFRDAFFFMRDYTVTTVKREKRDKSELELKSRQSVLTNVLLVAIFFVFVVMTIILASLVM